MTLNLLQAQEGLLIFCLALICAFGLKLSKLYHPNTVFALLTSNLAKRVVKKHNSDAQHTLSGTLACFLPILTVVVLLYTLSYISFYPQWFGGLILFLCLDTHFETRARRITKLISHGQKGSAKQLLTSIVSRDTDKLSEVGIIKACLDSLALNTVRHFYLVIIFYIIAGPYIALTYKLLLLCDQSWRQQLSVRHPFMRPVQRSIYLLEWLPLRGFAFIMALTQNFSKTRHYFKHYAQHYVNKNSGWVMALFSANLNVQLAGPRFYNNERFDNIRIGSDRQPVVEDIQHMLKLLSSMRLFWLGLTVLIWFAINLI